MAKTSLKHSTPFCTFLDIVDALCLLSKFPRCATILYLVLLDVKKKNLKKTGGSPSTLLMTVLGMKYAGKNRQHLLAAFTPRRAPPIPHA